MLTSLDVRSAALGPESGGAGALLALQPLQPAAKWQGRLGFLGAPSGLQTDVGASSAPALARLREALELSALASGPLAGERLGATFALEWEGAERSERGFPGRDRAERKSALGQLVFAPSQQQEARLLLGGHDTSSALADRALLAGVSWLRRGRSGGRLQAALSFANRSFGRGEESSPSLGLERLSSGPITDAVAIADTGSLRVLRGEVALAARARSFGRLRHEPQAMAQLEASRLTSDAGAPFVAAELVDGRAARAWSWGSPSASRRSLSRLALAVADQISVPDRLDAFVGLRLELQDGSRPDASGAISWLDLSPHVSMQARPLRGWPLLLHGGFARHAARLALPLLAFGDPGARAADVFRWVDANRDGRFQSAERGVLVARAGPRGGLTDVDPGLDAPRTTEFTAGLALERGSLRFTFAGIHRVTRGFPETINVGVPASRYRVRLIPDTGVDLVGAADDQLLAVFDRDPATFGQDRYLLANSAGHDVTHEGVEFALELSPAERLRLRLSGTASKTTGAGANRGFRASENDPGLPGELFDTPNADSFQTGRMFFDRAYTLKLAGVYRRGPWGAGFAARYQDGQPFARVVVAEGLAQGPELVAAVRRGDHRFTYILTLDARLARDFAIGRARATASVEAFSLGRQRREVEEYVVSGPAFRTVTATQPPRALRLGLTLAF